MNIKVNSSYVGKLKSFSLFTILLLSGNIFSQSQDIFSVNVNTMPIIKYKGQSDNSKIKDSLLVNIHIRLNGLATDIKEVSLKIGDDMDKGNHFDHTFKVISNTDKLMVEDSESQSWEMLDSKDLNIYIKRKVDRNFKWATIYVTNNSGQVSEKRYIKLSK